MSDQDEALVKAQNTAIQEYSKNVTISETTDDRKTLYQNTILRGNNYSVFVLFCLYYTLCLVVAFVLYKSPNYSIVVKVLVLFIFLVYPHVIRVFELTVYNILSWFKAIVTGTIYTRSSVPFPAPPSSPPIDPIPVVSAAA